MWKRTIADVRFDTAENYRADVRDWAIAVLADTEALVRQITPNKSLDNSSKPMYILSEQIF